MQGFREGKYVFVMLDGKTGHAVAGRLLSFDKQKKEITLSLPLLGMFPRGLVRAFRRDKAIKFLVKEESQISFNKTAKEAIRELNFHIRVVCQTL